MNVKRISSMLALLLVVALFGSALAGCATQEKIPLPTIEEDVYIYDADNAIDDGVEASLNKLLVQLEEKTGAEFAVISVESLLNRSIEDYANNLFNTLGIGKKGEDNGVLLLFSRADVRVRIEPGRGLEGCLNDAKCGRILDDYFVPYRETGEYTKATEETVKAVLQILCEEYGISIDGLDQEKSHDEETEAQDEEEMTDEEVMFFIILIIVVIVLAVLDVWLGGGSGGSSGGYYGGSSGGRSYGGSFGGGRSGGGGASR